MAIAEERFRGQLYNNFQILAYLLILFLLFTLYELPLQFEPLQQCLELAALPAACVPEGQELWITLFKARAQKNTLKWLCLMI